MSRLQITFRIGQAVPWSASPSGFAQITELRTRTLRIGYRTRRGQWKQPVVALSRVAAQQLLFQLDNPYNRGQIQRAKAYDLESAQ